MFKQVRSRLPTVALAATVLAACGGGDGERLAESEWIAEADAICAEAQDEIDSLPEPTNAAELTEQARQAVAIAERQLARLRDLRPPETAEDDYEAMLDLTQREIELTNEIAEAASAGDQARTEDLIAEAQRVDEEADALAAEYGFQECGGS
jgi:hypothetical protein